MKSLIAIDGSDCCDIVVDGDATASMDKTRAYRFDGNVRRFNYYRSPGQHTVTSPVQSLRVERADFGADQFDSAESRLAEMGTSLAH